MKTLLKFLFIYLLLFSFGYSIDPSTISANIPQISTQAQNNTESHSTSSSKHEKIRVKYVQSSYQSSSCANARVIVPKSKLKTTLGRTSTPNSSAASAATSTTNTTDNSARISRVLSFEKLIPLVENDLRTG